MDSLPELPHFLSNIFTYSPDPLFIKDSQFRYVYVNEAFLKFMGLSEKAVIGKDDYAIIHPDNPAGKEIADVCRANDAIILASEGGGPSSSIITSEEVLPTPTGTLYFSITRQKLTDSSQKDYVFGMVRDVTALRVSEGRHRESEKRFHDFLELIDEVLWTAHWPSGKITYASESLERVYGLSIKEFQTNEDWLKIYSPSELGRIGKMVMEAEVQRFPQFSGEFIFTHPVKGQRAAFVRGRIVRDENGEPIRIDGMISDITALQQAKAELSEQREKIFALSKLNTLGELASGIGHEINTPLSGILSKISRVEHKFSEVQADPTSIRLLRESMSLVERISEIVEGLKRLSKSDGNEEMETFSPLHVLEQALSLSRARFSNHGIRISIQNYLPIEQKVLGRPTSLFQALVNLLNNSFDALETNPSGGLVQIEMEAQGSRVAIRIIDNGSGISEQFRPYLFQAFQTTKPEGKGTGLGLSISRRLLRAMNGDLTLLPRNDRSTVFEVTLLAGP